MLFKGKTKAKEEAKEEAIFSVKPQEGDVEFPVMKNKKELNLRYPLIEPYAYAHIYWDAQNNELVYDVEEPLLNPEDKKILDILEKGIEELINISFISVNDERTVIEYLEKNLKVLITELKLKVHEDSFNKFMYYIYRDFVGLNEMEPFLKDFYIEDIECNGINTPVYLVHRKYRNVRTNLIYSDVDRLTSFVEKLAQKSGRYISYATPLLDGSLPDGTRVNATYTQDISSRGPTFTLRKFTKEPWSPVRLIQFRTVSPEILAYLWLLIENGSNIMVIGGTGAGKTSLLNSMAFFIPPQSRIVSIEDTRELALFHENWLPSVVREGIGINKEEGEIDMFTLLKESFRQRPDYVIVGEIRGKEAYVLFQGAASGHSTMSTMHAEDVNTMIRRLETKPIELSPSLVNTIDAVCVIGSIRKSEKNERRVKEIVEIEDVGERMGDVKTNTPFVWDPKTDAFFFKTESKILDRIGKKAGISRDMLQKEFSIRSRLLMKLYQNGIFDFRKVQEVINAYYKDRESVLMKYNLR